MTAIQAAELLAKKVPEMKVRISTLEEHCRVLIDAWYRARSHKADCVCVFCEDVRFVLDRHVGSRHELSPSQTEQK